MSKHLKYFLIFSLILMLIFSISCIRKTSDQTIESIDTDMSTASNTTESLDDYPDSIGYVNDFAGIFEKEYIDKMENLIIDLEKETTAEIVVVTVDSLGDKSIEVYTVGLFEAWGIGKKDIDNGILFLIAIEERECQIEVGYGLENVITDMIAKDILDEIVLPKFRDMEYGLGSFECISKISEHIISAK